MVAVFIRLGSINIAKDVRSIVRSALFIGYPGFFAERRLLLGFSTGGNNLTGRHRVAAVLVSRMMGVQG